MSHFKGKEIDKLMFPLDISVFKILLFALKKHGNDTALVEGLSGASASFSDMLQRSSSIAVGLQRAGVAVGDPVVMCCETSIVALETLLGVILSGATPVIVPEPAADKLDKLTQGHAVKAVFFHSTYADQVAESVSRMTSTPVLVSSTDPEDPVMASLLEASPDDLQEYEVKDPTNHIYIVICTSGTTGDPKGVPAVDIRDRKPYDDFQMRRRGPILVTTPFHMISHFFCFMLCIIYNVKLILSDMKNPTHNLRLIEKYKVKELVTETATLHKYVKEACPHQLDLSSLELLQPAGDIVYSSVASQFFHDVLHERDMNVLQMYGTTELGSSTQFITRTSELPALGLGPGGNVKPGCELKVVDAEGVTVEIGVVGEILTKAASMNIASGFWGRPELEPPIDKDGFHHTGDVGFFDEHGFLYLRGRVVDVIEYRGLKFYSAELVNELLWHPDILDAAAVGMPHPDDGQHPKALVVIRPESSVSPEEIVAFVNEKVQDHMRLRGGVSFVESLPRSKNGKMVRPLLQKLADSLQETHARA